MTESDYNETWITVDDEELLNCIKSCLKGTEDNGFEVYEVCKVNDHYDNYHYIVKMYAGKNGNGKWVSYLQDLSKIFSNLSNTGRFINEWLVEWKNNCASDVSYLIIGLRDKEIKYD